jgi:hypothetical protein
MDTPPLPGFEPWLSRQRENILYDLPARLYVTPDGRAGYVQTFRHKNSTIVRVDAGPRYGYDTEIRLQVSDTKPSRHLAIRAINFALYLRATGVVVDRKEEAA